jgi:hypothetical protein
MPHESETRGNGDSQPSDDRRLTLFGEIKFPPAYEQHPLLLLCLNISSFLTDFKKKIEEMRVVFWSSLFGMLEGDDVSFVDKIFPSLLN